MYIELRKEKLVKKSNKYSQLFKNNVQMMKNEEELNVIAIKTWLSTKMQFENSFLRLT